jgi:hypothetical protein
VTLHLQLHGHGASYFSFCILLVLLDNILQYAPSCHNGSIGQMSNLFPFVVLSSGISLVEICFGGETLYEFLSGSRNSSFLWCE